MGFKAEAHKSTVFEDNCWTQVKVLNLGKQTCIKALSQCTVYSVHLWIVHNSIQFNILIYFQEGLLPSVSDDEDETEEDSSEGEDTVDVNRNYN